MISARQRIALEFIARHPGCSIADVRRWEWSGRGHAASYARVSRLRRRGIVTGYRRGSRVALYVSTAWAGRGVAAHAAAVRARELIEEGECWSRALREVTIEFEVGLTEVCEALAAIIREELA